jgi:hypothetical protein
LCHISYFSIIFSPHLTAPKKATIKRERSHEEIIVGASESN